MKPIGFMCKLPIKKRLLFFPTYKSSQVYDLVVGMLFRCYFSHVYLFFLLV